MKPTTTFTWFFVEYPGISIVSSSLSPMKSQECVVCSFLFTFGNTETTPGISANTKCSIIQTLSQNIPPIKKNVIYIDLSKINNSMNKPNKWIVLKTNLRFEKPVHHSTWLQNLENHVYNYTHVKPLLLQYWSKTIQTVNHKSKKSKIPKHIWKFSIKGKIPRIKNTSINENGFIRSGKLYNTWRIIFLDVTRDADINHHQRQT